MKTKTEITRELITLQAIVEHARGIDRDDCPELLTKIQALRWVLGMNNELGTPIRLEIVQV